jgi:arsenate reductase (thioredoxin)
MITPRVLFVCTTNSTRSQMAEALLRGRGAGNFEAYSAGVAPGKLNPLAVRVLNEIGIDAASQWAKPVELFRGKMHVDYVITVCNKAEQRCPAFPPSTVRLHWPFDDPVPGGGSEEEKLARFRKVRDEIEKQILAWIAQVEAEKGGTTVKAG